ncbi:MAG TPA: HTTM domain-containing protein [Cyclobacteriaceae bacterium]
MKYINFYIDWITERLTSTFRGEAAVNVFCKAIQGFLLVKMLFSWSVSFMVLQYHPQRPNRYFIEDLFFWPSQLAYNHFIYFFWFCSAIILAAIIIKRNYLSAILVFWIALNLNRINFLANNGSDLVLIMLLFFTIPLSSFPRVANNKLFILQKALHNTALGACQVQIGLIYLLSGLDKITTRPWQTGEAFKLVSKLDFMVNARLADFFPDNYLEGFIVSWLIMLFEILFVFLVWWKETRWVMLAAGVIFHLFIWVMLSLPDFGLIMIISYIPFLAKEPRQDIVGDASVD